MKCPMCAAPCFDSDTWCLSCRQPLAAAGGRVKSAVWLCALIFTVLGTGLFIGLVDVAPHTRGRAVNFDQATNIGLVSLGSALFGVIVGWVLDRIARRN